MLLGQLPVLVRSVRRVIERDDAATEALAEDCRETLAHATGSFKAAKALAARSEFEPALDNMLAVVNRRGESMDEARKAMLDIFELLGDAHPLTGPYRRRLASALF